MPEWRRGWGSLLEWVLVDLPCLVLVVWVRSLSEKEKNEIQKSALKYEAVDRS